MTNNPIHLITDLDKSMALIDVLTSVLKVSDVSPYGQLFALRTHLNALEYAIREELRDAAGESPVLAFDSWHEQLSKQINEMAHRRINQ